MKYYTKILVILLVCILAPCITVFSITNFITLNQYQESVSTSQVNRLQSIDSINQLIINNMEQSALRMSLDLSVQAAGNVTQLDQGIQSQTQVRDLRRTMNTLVEYVRTNGLFQSVYFYVKDSDFIISSQDGIIELDRFADTAWTECYQNLQKDRQTDRMMPAHPITTGYRDNNDRINYSDQCLTYVYPITPYTSSFEGAIVFNIYESELLNLYMKKPFSGSMGVYDTNGSWLTGVNQFEGTSPLDVFDWHHIIDENSPNQAYSIFTKERIRYQYTYYRAVDNRYILMSVDNISQLMEKATIFQTIFVVFILLVVPFAALLIVVLSRRLYSPIGQLASELSNSGKLDMNIEKDEMRAISRAVQDLLKEDNRFFSDKNRERLRNATFLRILSEDVNQEDDDIQQIIPYVNHICIIAATDKTDNDMQKDQSYDARMRLLLRLIEQGLTGENCQATAMRYGKNLIVTLYSFAEKTEHLQAQLSAQLVALQPEIKAVMDHTATFAISALQRSSGGIRQSFDQAKSALEYRFIQGTQSILFYDITANNTAYFNTDERLAYIRRCLQTGKKEEVLQGMKELNLEIREKKCISFTCISLILNQLATTLTQYVMENHIDLEELLADQAAVYRQLWQNLTLEDAHQWLCSMITVVMDYHQSVETSSGNRYIREIIAYVKENFCEDITIDSIADHVGISYSHVRKLFKDATGQNLATYINSLRIKKAKQLLAETNYTIKEVASMCGYNHERSFSRTFTQSETMSPGKYKETFHSQG